MNAPFLIDYGMVGDLVIFVSNSLRRKRIAAGLSVDDLSRLTGISAESLNHYETSSKVMDFETLQTIADSLDGDVLSFFDGYVPSHPKTLDRPSEG